MNDKINSIGYCGLHCPDCYKMKVSEAAEILKKELKIAETKGASFFQRYPKINADLNMLIEIRCT